MAAKQLQINGFDFTDYITPAGYTVTYTKVSGSNEGIMLDGSYTEDILAIKAKVTFTLMPLQEGDQSTFLQEVFSGDYVTVYYFDPYKNSYRSAVMRYEIGNTKHRGTGTNQKEYWTGLTLSLEDRFNMLG